jgi:hypothetical protein
MYELLYVEQIHKWRELGIDLLGAKRGSLPSALFDPGLWTDPICWDHLKKLDEPVEALTTTFCPPLLSGIFQRAGSWRATLFLQTDLLGTFQVTCDPYDLHDLCHRAALHHILALFESLSLTPLD